MFRLMGLLGAGLAVAHFGLPALLVLVLAGIASRRVLRAMGWDPQVTLFRCADCRRRHNRPVRHRCKTRLGKNPVRVRALQNERKIAGRVS